MADSTIEAIQTINATVGLNAPYWYPSQITQAQYPIAVTFLGPMEGAKFPHTTYIVKVLLADAAGPINPNQIFQQGNQFLKALRDAYKVLGTINGYALIMGGKPTSRGGSGMPYGMLRTVEYAGSEHYGTELHLTLLEPV